MTETPFAIGASASCADGDCGQVVRVIVNPVGRAITYLVVGPKHEHGHDIDRLVPVDLAEATADGIRLSCSKAEFDRLDPAEETHFVAGGDHPGYEPDQVLCLPYHGLSGVWTEGQGWDAEGSHGPRRRTVTYDSVPLGEVQVRRCEHVHATDGEIGLVEGLVIDPDDHRVTHVLLQEGHLWGRRQVAIPISAVTGVEAGIRLDLSRRQVEELPPVAIDSLTPR
ncbi:PRC-barrel domain-containing protein [Trebonia sp.]|uniref:PRC-barrel domain-containing protein n=1 Tax=Trebonia sp. TaxID=2767075 RepID=UPI002637C835|nr:PRC-barrel domain-containing protein [Trebonia sp.]